LIEFNYINKSNLKIRLNS